MKCPRCGRNQPRKDGPYCGCGYHFVFDPVEDRMTDGRFAAMIRAVGANGAYYFTANQLWAHYLRQEEKRSRRGRRFGCAAAVVVVFVSILVAFSTGPIALAAGLAAAGLIFFFCRRLGRVKIDRAAFDRKLASWTAAHPDEKLIRKPRLNDPPPDYAEPDIYDYGVERVLVVDQDLLVDLLVLNGFHTEHRCLVISVNGYPDYLISRLALLIQEKPDLSIYYAHSAPDKPHGAYGLRRAQAMTGRKDLIDLGYFHEDLKTLPMLKSLPEDAFMRVPLDAAPFGRLNTLFTGAFASGLAFSSMLAHQAYSEDYG